MGENRRLKAVIYDQEGGTVCEMVDFMVVGIGLGLYTNGGYEAMKMVPLETFVQVRAPADISLCIIRRVTEIAAETLSDWASRFVATAGDTEVSEVDTEMSEVDSG